MADDVHAERREPEQPRGAFDLGDGARELLDQARELSAGRSARTLTPGAGAPLKQTLVALCEGGELDEDAPPPGPVTIQVLLGAVTLRTDGDDVELREGQWAAIATAPFDVRAESDAAVLLTVASTS